MFELDRFGTRLQEQISHLEKLIDFYRTTNPDVCHKLMLRLEELKCQSPIVTPGGASPAERPDVLYRERRE